MIADIIDILNKLIENPEENNVFVDFNWADDHKFVFFGKNKEYEISIHPETIRLTYKRNHTYIDITNKEKYELLVLFEKLNEVCENLVINKFNNYLYND